MIQVDVIKDEVTALRLIHLHLGDAIFPMLKGDDVSELATARARLPGLAAKLAKYIAELDAKTVDEMAKKAKKDAPKDPIKRAGS
jgi:hypothetical protein